MPEVVNTSALTVEDEAAEVEDNRPVMIDVDHVSMSFNMASEQLNNLKEYAIAIARGKLYFEEFKALDDVSFKVRKGDVFGIMGTNGSGKSTILKIIAGVLEPTKGKCTVNGNIAPLIELGAGFDMDLSARENIYLNGALLGYSKQFIDDHFQEIVEFAEVEKFLDMPLKNYSSGMVARIAFAIATVIVPEILVVDEVLSVGDFMFQKKCEDRITQLIEEYGVTVLIVSHSNDQIARLCNKAVWIEKGHVRLQGAAQMVAGVYSGLGGRSGSSESEEVVFAALKKSAECHADNQQRRSVNLVDASSSAAIGARMVLAAWADEPIRDLVLALDNTHVNAIVANGYAGALGAPVLSTGGVCSLSDAVERILFQYKPSAVHLFDVSSGGVDIACELERLPWNPVVKWIKGDSDVVGFCKKVYDSGLSNGLWSREAACFDFNDNSISFAASCYCYRYCVPVFLYCNLDELSFVEAILKENGIDRVFPQGHHAQDVSDWQGEGEHPEIVLDGTSESDGQSTHSVASVWNRRLESEGCKPRLLMASSNITQWPDLVSVGCYCSKLNSSFLMVDVGNLDDESCCIRDIAQMNLAWGDVTFIAGSNGLSSNDRILFLSQTR